MCEESCKSLLRILIKERLFKTDAKRPFPKVLEAAADCVGGSFYVDNSEIYEPKVTENEEDICDRLYQIAENLQDAESPEEDRKVYGREECERKLKENPPDYLTIFPTLNFTVSVFEHLHKNNKWDPEHKNRNTLMNCLFCLNPYILWTAVRREFSFGYEDRNPAIQNAIRNVLEFYILAVEVGSDSGRNKRSSSENKKDIWMTYNKFHHIFEIERAVCDPFDKIYKPGGHDGAKVITELGVRNFDYFTRKLAEYMKENDGRKQKK